MKVKKFSSLFILFLTFSANLSFICNFLEFNGHSIYLINEKDLKTANYWDLTGSNIIVDDTNPSRSWVYTTSNYDWCSGSGTWNDPYIIENVTINGESARTCISIQNSNVFFKIKNCTLYNSGTITTRKGIELDNVQNGLIIENNCSQNGYGIVLYSSYNITVFKNNASKNAYSGIVISSSSLENKILDNIIHHNYGSGIYAGTSDYITISDNIVNNNDVNGIILYDTDHSIVSNNTIINNGGPYGILLRDGCTYDNITGNNIHNNDRAGILVGTDYNEPRNNIISGNNLSNHFHGIHLDGDSVDRRTPSDNTVDNNLVYLNEYGIFLYYARDNVIFENNLTNNNQFGICIRRSGSINNLVFKNRFVGNLDNAKDEVGGNPWDNGVIGNFYDDYSGKDKNDDGIGDIPYNITGSILDNFPIWDDGNDIPIINISKPTNGTFFGSFAPNYNVSIFAADLDTSWYSLNNGINYTFINLSGIMNQSAWDACDNGTIKIEFFVNDTAGNLGYDEIYVYKDIYIPIITIISPKNKQLFSHNTIDFEILIDESNLNITWYTLNGGKSYFFNETIGTLDTEEWESCGNGTVIIRFYANDSAGNIGLSEVSIRKDIEKPKISIISPTPFQLFGNNTFNFELNITEGNLNTTWYTLDNGLNNHTFIGISGIIDQDAWIACDNGSVIMRFYANDSVGNLGFKEIIVRKDKINPTINIIKPEPKIIFGNSTFSYEIHIEEANLHRIWYSFDDGIKNYFINQSIGVIDQEAWESIGNGTIVLTFYANDSVGNLGVSKVSIRKNMYAPVITFEFSNTYLNTTTPEYYHKELEISCEILNFTSLLWIYLCENSSGIIENRSMAYFGNGIWKYTVNITTLELGDQFSFYFLTKDILGYISIKDNFSSMYTIKIHDFQAPVITIYSPVFNQLFGIIAPTFDLQLNEPNLQETWYSFNGGANISFSTQTEFDQLEWDKLGNGTVIIRFYAQDLAGNINFSEVMVRKDAYIPEITIYSPVPDERFGSVPPEFNISIVEEDLLLMWYTIEGITGIFLISESTGSVDLDAWMEIPEIGLIITFYAEDRAGNIGSESVNVIKSIPTPSKIPGYNVILLIGAIHIILIILIKKEMRK